MKQLSLTVALTLCFVGGALADPAAGVWKTADGEEGGYLHVSIAPCGSQICGTILKAFDAQGAAAPEYQHVGKRLLWDMQADGDGTYSNGRIWAPDADATYRSKMILSGNTLTVSGCVAGGLICRGQDWTRVN